MNITHSSKLSLLLLVLVLSFILSYLLEVSQMFFFFTFSEDVNVKEIRKYANGRKYRVAIVLYEDLSVLTSEFAKCSFNNGRERE